MGGKVKAVRGRWGTYFEKLYVYFEGCAQKISAQVWQERESGNPGEKVASELGELPRNRGGNM